MSDTDSSGKQSARRLWPLFVGLPLLAAIAVAAVLLSGGQERSVRPAGENHQARQPAAGDEHQSRQPAAGEEASRGGGNLEHPSLGSRDAPVVMVEYSDYQ